MATATKTTIKFEMSDGKVQEKQVIVPNGADGIGRQGLPGPKGSRGTSFEQEVASQAARMDFDTSKEGVNLCGLIEEKMLYTEHYVNLPLLPLGGEYYFGTRKALFVGCNEKGNMVPGLYGVTDYRAEQVNKSFAVVRTVFNASAAKTPAAADREQVNIKHYLSLETGRPQRRNLYYIEDTSPLKKFLPKQPTEVVVPMPRTDLVYTRKGG